ncbi:long-chain fatty acid [Babesia ovata]|uniref:Long-chain-fatty-acid--CoA ligase n=1 Tax=Babesia ovata TaxID=189622 RepID=A0A2H6KGK7_9APIC|nr:long-chain fatty acid [Babesia ovata]GBE62125.1 long-chain fatty acid [Babesia ovata]
MEAPKGFSNLGALLGFYGLAIAGTEEEGFSPIYRNAASETLKRASDHGDFHTMWDVFQHGLKINPDAPCIGKREVKPDGSLGAYRFMTYKEVETKALVIGSALHQLPIEEQPSCHPKVKDSKMVGVFVTNCIEWLILEQSCNAYGYTLVPIYNTLGNESIHTILKNSGITVLVCTPATAKTMLDILGLGTEGVNLELIILIDCDSVDDVLKNNSYGISFMLWRELEAMGSKKPLPPSPPHPDTLALISYTSGTSGTPKGVMLTQQNITDLIVVTCEDHVKRSFIEKPMERHISYLPMAHLFEKNFVNAVYYFGGCIGLYSGDIKKILDDVQELKPTFFLGVPRLFQRIHDRVMANVAQKSFVVRALFKTGLAAKMNRINTQGIYTHALWDKLIFNKLKLLLGGQVKWMLVGSSGMNPNVIERLRAIFGVPLLWGYALTESGAGSTAQNFYDTDPTSCGGPLPNQEFRLRSVPDLQYDATAQPPRGELLIRGYNVMHGYYRDEKATKEALVDGWLHTGDVVEILPSGSIRIIDRVKNVFKLAQGEYVSPGMVESVINMGTLVAQSFVFGKNDEVYTVAVVVPDEDVLKHWKESNGMGSLSFKEVCGKKELRDAIMAEMEKLFQENGLKGYEKVKAIHVEHEPFSVENDLLTVTAKLRRHKLRERYAAEIDALYKELRAANKAA